MIRLADLSKKTKGMLDRVVSDPPLSRHIPYTHFLDTHTIQSRGGRLLQIIRLVGLDTSTLSEDEIDEFTRLRGEIIFGAADEDLSVYTHTLRRKGENNPVDFPEVDSFPARLGKAFADKQGDVLVNEIYISLELKPTGGLYGTAKSWIARLRFRSNSDSKRKYLAERAEVLSDRAKVLVDRLSEYQAQRLRIQPCDGELYSEALSFLFYLVNARYQRLRLPRMNLGRFLAASRIFFHRETISFRGLTSDRLAAMLSIKEYSDETAPEMLDDLMKIPFEFILTQSFSFTGRQAALGMMKRQERYIRLSEDYSVTQGEEILIAMDDVQAGRYGMGRHHCSIMALADTEAELSKGVNAIQAAIVGVVLVREDMNTEPAYFAQLPGNLQYIGRGEIISTRNFASFSSFHNMTMGRRDGNYWGDSVCQLQTPWGGPFYFNFHTKIDKVDPDKMHLIGPPAANTTIIGQTGSGKTLLMNFLVAMAQKFQPRTIFLDKDRGVELLVKAHAGSYMIISPEGMGCNPLQLADTPINRGFLESWFETLLTCNGEVLDSDERNIVQQAIAQGYAMLPVEKRQLRHVVPFFGQGDAKGLSARLSQWHSGGARAWLFDNPVDSISLEAGMTGFDLTYLLTDSISQNPFNQYLFHCIDASLDGRPTIIPVSEAWSHFRNAYSADGLADFLKTIRKKNGFVILETQELEDAANSSIQSTVRSQTVTNIFLPDPKADTGVYKTFGLNDHEIGLVRKMDPTLHQFLIKQGGVSVIVKLDLSGMEDFIAILSSNTALLTGIDNGDIAPVELLSREAG